MLGCDLHCGYCQNWGSSQALRDPQALAAIQPATPEQLVRLALDSGAEAIVSTYNEPSSRPNGRWRCSARRTAPVAHGLRIKRQRHPEVLEYLRPHLDLFKVDLKSFDELHYTSSAAVSSRSWTASGSFTRWVSGWRW